MSKIWNFDEKLFKGDSKLWGFNKNLGKMTGYFSKRSSKK